MIEKEKEESNKDSLKEEEKKEDEAVNEKKTKKLVKEKEEEIAKLKAEAAQWKNAYYQAYADTQNLRKSIEKDHQEALKYRAEGFVDKLLPALDGFHMALAIEPSNPETKNFLVGFKYVYNSLVEALSSEGVSELEPKVGDKFDASYMHAVDTEVSEGPENIVLRVNAKGYKLKDRLVRPAMVVVSKKEVKQEIKLEAGQEEKATEKTDA